MEFNKEFLGVWVSHDDIACQALKEYENAPFKKTYRLMNDIATNHNTTIEEMKKHWKCLGL